MKKENLNALISVALIAFLALCIFGIGYLIGHRRGVVEMKAAIMEVKNGN